MENAQVNYLRAGAQLNNDNSVIMGDILAFWQDSRLTTVEEAGYTHFAGPIPQPDLPEPTSMTITGLLCRSGDGRVYMLGGIPPSFIGAKLKITLEKVDD